LDIKILNHQDLTLIRVLDLQGRTIETYQTSNPKFRIPLTHISNGIYFIEVANQSGKKAERFVIAR